MTGRGYRVPRAPGHKYHAVRTLYNGRTYHSIAEADYAALLDLQIEAGQVARWLPQFAIRFRVNGKHICEHDVDFWVEYTDGHIELIEVKGVATEAWRIKRALLEAIYLQTHPEITYRVLYRWPDKSYRAEKPRRARAGARIAKTA